MIVLLFCDILGTFSNGSWYEREALEMKRCQYLFVISLHTSHHITRWVQISLNTLTHWYLNTLTLEDCERMSTERCFVGCLKKELVLLDWCWLFVVNGPLISLQDSHVIHFKIRFMVHVEKHKYFTLNVFDFKPKHCVVSNECHIYCVLNQINAINEMKWFKFHQFGNWKPIKLLHYVMQNILITNIYPEMWLNNSILKA